MSHIYFKFWCRLMILHLTSKFAISQLKSPHGNITWNFLCEWAVKVKFIRIVHVKFTPGDFACISATALLPGSICYRWHKTFLVSLIKIANLTNSSFYWYKCLFRILTTFKRRPLILLTMMRLMLHAKTRNISGIPV